LGDDDRRRDRPDRAKRHGAHHGAPNEAQLRRGAWMLFRINGRNLAIVATSLLAVLFATLFTSLATTGAQPLSAFARGDVFAAVGNGQVRRFSPDGTLLQTLDTGVGGQTAGMAFDVHGNLYVTNFGTNQVIKFGPDGQRIGLFGGGYDASPESIVIDKAQRVYVGHADGQREVRQFDADGTLLDTYALAIEERGSDWIDLAVDQKTLFYTSEDKHVKRYDLVAKRQLPDLNSEALPDGKAFALRILADDTVIVADTRTILRLSLTGKVIQAYDAPGEDEWFAVNLDPDGETFWSGNVRTGQVYRFNIQTGVQVAHWSAGSVQELSGLAVYGEITAAQPTATPAPSSTPTLRPTVTPTATRTASPTAASTRTPTSTHTSAPTATPTSVPFLVSPVDGTGIPWWVFLLLLSLLLLTGVGVLLARRSRQTKGRRLPPTRPPRPPRPPTPLGPGARSATAGDSGKTIRPDELDQNRR
jgi:outer membrane protein assembly factor BamB